MDFVASIVIIKWLWRQKPRSKVLRVASRTKEHSLRAERNQSSETSLCYATLMCLSLSLIGVAWMSTSGYMGSISWNMVNLLVFIPLKTNYSPALATINWQKLFRTEKGFIPLFFPLRTGWELAKLSKLGSRRIPRICPPKDTISNVNHNRWEEVNVRSHL